MSDADCTSGREPRSVAASVNILFIPEYIIFATVTECFIRYYPPEVEGNNLG